MSEYEDIQTLQTTGCWPNGKVPKWAAAEAARLHCQPTSGGVIQAGLRAEIDRLRVELHHRPTMVAFDPDCNKPFEVDQFPSLIKPAHVYSIEVRTDKGTWKFHSVVCTETPHHHVEYEVAIAASGESRIVPTTISLKRAAEVAKG